MIKKLIYIKDKEGYVKGIYPEEMKDEYTVINKIMGVAENAKVPDANPLTELF